MSEKISVDQKPYGGSSSLFGGYTILAKSMMGSGLLGVAAACSKDGWILGMFFSILIPIVTFVSLHLLAMIALNSDVESRPITFYKLCNSILGPAGGLFVEISLILKTFGAAIVYLQVAGSMLSGLIAPHVSSMDQGALCRLIQVSMAVFFAPFCYLKQVTKTALLNAIGILCLVFIVVAACWFYEPGLAGNTQWTPTSVSGVLSKIPIFVFAYSCHQNVFACIDETRNPSIKRMDVIMSLACLTGFMIYSAVMILPYATFGDSVSDNFLKNLPTDSIVTKVAYVCAAVSVCISFPLQVLPLRNSVCSLLFLKFAQTEKNIKRFRIIVATIAVVLALAVAVSVSSLGVVMSITGLIGGNTVCFLTPSLLYVKRFNRDHYLWYIAAAVLIWSVALYPLCLTGIFMNL